MRNSLKTNTLTTEKNKSRKSIISITPTQNYKPVFILSEFDLSTNSQTPINENIKSNSPKLELEKANSYSKTAKNIYLSNTTNFTQNYDGIFKMK